MRLFLYKSKITNVFSFTFTSNVDSPMTTQHLREKDPTVDNCCQLVTQIASALPTSFSHCVDQMVLPTSRHVGQVAWAKFLSTMALMMATCFRKMWLVFQQVAIVSFLKLFHKTLFLFTDSISCCLSQPYKVKTFIDSLRTIPGHNE